MRGRRCSVAHARVARTGVPRLRSRTRACDFVRRGVARCGRPRLVRSRTRAGTVWIGGPERAGPGARSRQPRPARMQNPRAHCSPQAPDPKRPTSSPARVRKRSSHQPRRPLPRPACAESAAQTQPATDPPPVHASHREAKQAKRSERSWGWGLWIGRNFLKDSALSAQALGDGQRRARDSGGICGCGVGRPAASGALADIGGEDEQQAGVEFSQGHVIGRAGRGLSILR